MNVMPIKIIASRNASLIVNNNTNIGNFCIRHIKIVTISFKVYKCSMEKVTALENYVTSIKVNFRKEKTTRLC
jgi:hypothetical protein